MRARLADCARILLTTTGGWSWLGGATTLANALDLSDVTTIKTFAAAFNKKHKKLDILVNNAGLNTTGAYKGPTVTSQDYEICMGTNYFGHFMLTALLMARGDTNVQNVH